MLITNGNLETVDQGVSYIIKTDKEVLDKCVPRVINVSCSCANLTGDEAWMNGVGTPTARFVDVRIMSLFRLYIFPCSQSGLTQACIDSPHSKDFVRQEVLNYIKKWIPKDRIGVLAGNSVHMDRVFLVEEMPEVVEWLHYRIVGESLRIS